MLDPHVERALFFFELIASGVCGMLRDGKGALSGRLFGLASHKMVRAALLLVLWRKGLR